MKFDPQPLGIRRTNYQVRHWETSIYTVLWQENHQLLRLPL